MMTRSGAIDDQPINVNVVNGPTIRLITLSVDNADMAILINDGVSGAIDDQPMNINVVNGPATSEPTLVQTHILAVADAAIALTSLSPTLAMIHLLTIHNVYIPLAADHVRMSRTQGGALLVTITTPGSDVYRFSFEGVKA